MFRSVFDTVPPLPVAVLIVDYYESREDFVKEATRKCDGGDDCYEKYTIFYTAMQTVPELRLAHLSGDAMGGWPWNLEYKSGEGHPYWADCGRDHSERSMSSER